jgi:hypothetical protein
VIDAYFTVDAGWFRPTELARGPWDKDACHAGPPTALMARAVERLVPSQRLVRLTVELMRPIPMAGFRVQGEIRRPGRQVTLTEAELFDDETVFARAFGLHIRRSDPLDVPAAPGPAPDLATARPGPFPIRRTAHGSTGFVDSVEVRYDPAESYAAGGPTTMWMRTLVPVLPDEEPGPFQRICPLADCGNGISFLDSIERVSFVNADLTISLHREPVGDWFASRARSHWQPDGIGSAEASLFDVEGPVGSAVQNLVLLPPPAQGP